MWERTEKAVELTGSESVIAVFFSGVLCLGCAVIIKSSNIEEISRWLHGQWGRWLDDRRKRVRVLRQRRGGDGEKKCDKIKNGDAIFHREGRMIC
ncbi:hypothetical protein N9268_03085 [Akkermansiaceae bacterium]|nr:hypothetical protein [Akkermansiaceae bacterium]